MQLMIYLVSILLIMLFILVPAWFVLTIIWLLKPRKSKNPYIDLHRPRFENDINYESYLKWCDEHDQIPMDKIMFEEEQSIVDELRINRS